MGILDTTTTSILDNSDRAVLGLGTLREYQDSGDLGNRRVPGMDRYPIERDRE